MIYDKKDKKFRTQTEDDRAWVSEAWSHFLAEVYTKGNYMVKNIFKEWSIQTKDGVNYIAYPESFMKTHKQIKQERDLRNKLAKINMEYHEKILKVWKIKSK